MIQQFRLGLSNVFLIKEDGAILVDTGRPRDALRIVDLLKQAGVALADLSLILHTHGHWDHAGSTWQLKQWTRAPAAIHRGDAGLLVQGTNGFLKPTSWWARLLKPFLDWPFPRLTADVLLEDEMDLAVFGIHGRILSTPGHTAGSISLLTAEGDAIVGDLLMGGYLGGRVFRHRPTYHYFAEDPMTLRASIKKLLSFNPRRIYVGHGGPLDALEVVRRLGKDIGLPDGLHPSAPADRPPPEPRPV
jgi:hydroxyacylglutathione hydrolase